MTSGVKITKTLFSISLFSRRIVLLMQIYTDNCIASCQSLADNCCSFLANLASERPRPHIDYHHLPMHPMPLALA